MNLGHKGKTVIITGGAKGIGSGISEVFAREGANLVINYHSCAKESETFGNSLKGKYGIGVICVQGDIGNEGDVVRIYDEAEKAFGSLDVLVNNAGRGFTKDFWDISLEDWNQQLNDNLTGQFLMAREFARRMVPSRRRGWIVNILSKATMTSTTKGRVTYVSNKAGEMGLTHSLAVDLTEYGIHVNGVMPGFVMASTMRKQLEQDPEDYKLRVERVPIKRPGDPVEIGNMVAFLASDQCELAVGTIVDMTGGLLLGY